MFFFIFPCILSISQDCLPLGITVTTQAEVDSFNFNYPGCDNILGRLRLEGDDINNVDSLYNLKRLGDLILWSPVNINSLFGLRNVDTIREKLWIIETEQLEDLTGLESMKKVGEISIQYNDLIENVNAISQIDVSGAAINISNNAALDSIVGFNEVEKLSYLIIEENQSLKKINGFKGIDSIQFEVRLSFLPELEFLDVIENVAYIGGRLEIENNDRLDFLPEFNNLQTVHNLVIEGNDNIMDITGFNNLEFVRSHLSISHNNRIRSIEAFNQIKTIGNDCQVHLNDNLVRIDVFNAVDSILGSLTFRATWQTSSEEFTFNAFSNLKYIDNSFVISDFRNLRTINGFTKLNHAGNYMYLQSLESLEALNNFSNLEYVGRHLSLVGLNSISDLLPLSKLKYQELDTLIIAENENLSICNSYPICKFIEEEIGDYLIQDNKEGCNTAEEILAQCALNNTNDLDYNDLTIYPNPSRDYLHLKGDHDYNFISYSIYNTLGVLLKTDKISIGKIDISNLSNGIYTLVLEVNNKKVAKKFLKIK